MRFLVLSKILLRKGSMSPSIDNWGTLSWTGSNVRGSKPFREALHAARSLLGQGLAPVNLPFFLEHSTELQRVVCVAAS